MKLRWKRDKRENGIRGRINGPRGSTLRDSKGTKYASVSTFCPRIGYLEWKWYFCAGWDSIVPHFNSCDHPARDEAHAKEQAEAYVRKHLAAAEKKKAVK